MAFYASASPARLKLSCHIQPRILMEELHRKFEWVNVISFLFLQVLYFESSSLLLDVSLVFISTRDVDHVFFSLLI